MQALRCTQCFGLHELCMDGCCRKLYQLDTGSRSAASILVRPLTILWCHASQAWRARADEPGSLQVSQMKQTIRKELIEVGDCLAYSEPESRVVSRSGDE